MRKRTVAALAVSLFLLAVSAWLSAPAPAAADVPCFAYGTCLACSGSYAKPCIVVQCGIKKTYNCGSCQLNCVPPDA